MTAPRFRRHPDSRAPAFADGFGNDDRDITEVIGRPADWDAGTIAWGGASDVGLPAGGAGDPPGSGYHSGIGTNTTWHPGQYPPGYPKSSEPTAPFGRLRAQPPRPAMFPALQPSFTPAAPVGYEVIGRETVQGWPKLPELRCGYPAALAETPIPCDSVHRDAAATTFRDLRLSAQAAGWHMDAYGRWACARCCQASPEYRTLYPVTVGDPLAAEAYVAGDLRGENRERARAELGLRERTLEHYEAGHGRGRHARAARRHAAAAS